MNAPRIVHGGGIAAAAARFGGRPEDWLDLSTGINPNPVALPPVEIAAWHRLPDHHRQDAARTAAALYYGAAKARPLPVPGTQSVIQLLPRLVAAGRRAAVLAPTYGEYARVLGNAGVAVDPVKSPDDVTEAHGLVIVVNPNNPDGRLFPRDTLLDLHRRVHFRTQSGTARRPPRAFRSNAGNRAHRLRPRATTRLDRLLDQVAPRDQRVSARLPR